MGRSPLEFDLASDCTAFTKPTMVTSILPRPREKLASFVSRTAAAYHVDAATFSADRETSFLAVISGASTAIDALEAFGCPIPDNVIAWSPSKEGAGKAARLFRYHAFSSKVLQPPTMRGCVECLLQDLECRENSSAAMAMRGHWLVPHVTLCLEHGMPLVTLWRESSPVLRFELRAETRRAGPCHHVQKPVSRATISNRFRQMARCPPGRPRRRQLVGRAPPACRLQLLPDARVLAAAPHHIGTILVDR